MTLAALLTVMLLAPCETPAPHVLHAGIISTEQSHENLDWISSDGRQIFFTRTAVDFSQSFLFLAEKQHNRWRVKQLAFSTGPYDAGLTLSADGAQALFTSTRQGPDNPEGDWNIWRARTHRTGSTPHFNNVAPLPSPINSASNECCVVYGEDGEIFFSSNRGGDWSLYRAMPTDDGYEVALLEGAINTPHGAWPSAFLVNENILLFSSIRKSGAGGDDIYWSQRTAGEWSAGRLFGEFVNKPGYEDGARLFHGRFYWSSRPLRDEKKAVADLNVSDIFYMPAACMNELNTSKD